MDYLAEAMAALQLAENAYNIATHLMQAAKAKGDPTPQEVSDQQARAKAASDRFDALIA